MGFAIGERLRELSGTSSWSDKFGGKFAKISVENDSAIVVLPQTYMNRSGEVLSPFLNFYKLAPTSLIVVHDEVDLDPGMIRVQRGGSPAGHNGVRDIIDKLSSDNFYRIRVGVGHPRKLGDEAAMEMHSWVLGRPSAIDKAAITDAEQRAVEAIGVLVKDGLEKAQLVYNRKQS